jgi:DNA-binding beta-propeller fold protein YncE
MASAYQVYVSFSGETGDKIQNVGALAADGAFLGDVLANGGPFDELRGLALDAQGRLYVANAYKKATAVDVFSATVNADGFSRDFVVTLITPATSRALLHPYELAFDGDNLFVSSQDTNVVSGYAISGKKTPSAKKLPVASYLAKLNAKGGYYGGTFVASADPVKVRKQTPPAVDPDKGGLSASGFVAKTAATDDDPPEAADEAKPPAKQARHSVRGIAFAGKRLYVADQAKSRVGIYGHKSGTFHGWIDATADTSAKPNALDMPVGIAVNPVDGRVYIGSPKNDAIFAYDPKSEKLELIVSSATSGVPAGALHDLSGIAFTPDGTLLFGSRSQQQLYTLATSGAVAPFGDKLHDAPECLLVSAV